ncbi:hypothetical protein ACFY9N_00845 [Microbacterium sp. NPDC008134]|uniref:hypothetical protein n=1 Tax=Microbacterium sp. NPDC008134 TaxID=3364183 RepID=UPI0036EFB084
MDDADLSEIELISDGDGIALIGPPSAVELFLTSHGLASRELDLPRLSSAFGGGAATLQTGSEIAANSGRWMKLTEESYAATKLLPKMQNSTTGNWHASLKAPGGGIAKNLQFLKTPGSILTNPAMLAGAAGIMAQLAMQQTMDEITDYLAVIDEKVDDILRAQKDAVIADMIGVDLVIEEAMVIRKQVGRVSDVTWSKIQGTSMTITRTQAYALRQLDALAEKIEKKSRISELVDSTKDAEDKVQEWLAVIARCFQLHDALAILELDRVLDTSPDELDKHRIALQTARANRIELISRSTLRMIERIDAAASTANAKVLFNPIESPTVVRSRNRVVGRVGDFHGRLGIEAGDASVDARRWTTAVGDTRDDIVEAGTDGVEAALRTGADVVNASMRFGSDAVDRAKDAAGSFASFAERTLRRRKDADKDS